MSEPPASFIAQEGQREPELAVVNPTTVIGPLLGLDDPPTLRIIGGMLGRALPASAVRDEGSVWIDQPKEIPEQSAA
ncbi:hypothetical protein NicSoilB8_45200 (plasmid) [Arthrobacter sp. NicSoilB8]|nr:hypothetical protein NicSoilB8_45200 [Arthrobacter sp. NicSoilB8]